MVCLFFRENVQMKLGKFIRGLAGSNPTKSRRLSPPGGEDGHPSQHERAAAGEESVVLLSRLTVASDERQFSLRRLAEENPSLASQFLWYDNPTLAGSDELWLHLGCGVRVFEGFVNLDIAPQDPCVVKWNFLDFWPDELKDEVEGLFSEDCLEHFYYAEQIYILCNVNRVLKQNSVARILMPSLSKLVDSYLNFNPTPGESFLHPKYGTGTGGDNLNYGLRFTGHRWLHDLRSLTHMAALCGFDLTATDCASSTVAKLNGLNLRDESNSASFANDLRKTSDISRLLVSPVRVKGATKVEDLTADAALFVATSERPIVEYPCRKACLRSRSHVLISDRQTCRHLIGASRH